MKLFMLWLLLTLVALLAWWPASAAPRQLKRGDPDGPGGRKVATTETRPYDIDGEHNSGLKPKVGRSGGFVLDLLWWMRR